MYIVRTKMDGKFFYLKFLGSGYGGWTYADFTLDINDALVHTKKEMEYVKEWCLPRLGRWVRLDNERERVGKGE